MKKLTVVGLILLILLLVMMPLGMGMPAMSACPSCPALASMAKLCAAVGVFFALMVLLLCSRLAQPTPIERRYALVRRIDRPPRTL